MMHHFNLQPTVWHAKPWVFDWDDEAGEIFGPNANDVRAIASWGGVSAHPLPWAWEFSKNPLKNKTDMAAIIGWEHRLPDELVDYYPRLPDDDTPEETYVDEDGIVVIGKDRMTY